MDRKLALAAAAALFTVPAPVAATALDLASTQQPADPDPFGDFNAALAEMRALLLRPGDRVEGWERGGADPDAELRARGVDRHYYLSSGGQGGTSVGMLTDRPIGDFVPTEWRVVDSFGSESTDPGTAEIDFEALSARYVIGMRSVVRRVNDVDCFESTAHALLLEVPDAPARPDDEIIPILFRMSILAMEGQIVCVRSDGDPGGAYRFRYFLPDGRLLPELIDPNEVTRIVPAAPIDTLLVPPPPRLLESEPTA